MLQRTAKSCGPDAPTLASSLRSCVGPTGLRQNISADDGGKRARSPGRARYKLLKPLRAGMPGDSGVLVVTRVRSTTIIAHETAGALGIRRSPRPLWAEDSINASGASRREGEVVSANETSSFPDVQLHIVDAPLGAGPESILPVVVMDSGLARSPSSGRPLRGPVGAPRNDGRRFVYALHLRAASVSAAR